MIDSHCLKCGKHDELRFGYCFDCASDGDIRLGKRSILEHWSHGIGSVFAYNWLSARIDFQCGWERLWRSGEYAPGHEWENL